VLEEEKVNDAKEELGPLGEKPTIFLTKTCLEKRILLDSSVLQGEV